MPIKYDKILQKLRESDEGGVSVSWGDVSGTLSAQTDLQTALNGKQAVMGADDNYVTDAQLIVIGNTSGTNTGDQDLSGYGLLANPLSQFAATTSLQLAGVISDETGSGSLVFATSPTLVTPELGVATATSLAVPTITTASGALTITPASGSGLNINLATTGDLAVNTNQLYVDTSSGYVGIGTTAPKQKLNITTGVGMTYPTLGTGTGNVLFGSDNNLYGLYQGSSTDGNSWFQVMRNDSAVAYHLILQPSGGNVGIGTTAPLSKLDVRGSSYTTDIYTYNTTSSTATPLSVELVRTLSGTVGDTVELGNLNLGNGGHNIRISVTASIGGFSTAKQYIIPAAHNQTNNTWQIVNPVSSTGAYSSEDFLLEVNVNTTVASFRLRKSLGTTGGSVQARVESTGNTADAWTASTTTSTSSVTELFSSTPFTQVAGNVGVGTTAPGKALEINSATGANLRLTYNDADGSAVNYADFSMSSGGDLTITPSGGDVAIVGDLTISANDIITDTTTGMKIGTATGQKIGLWNATPIVQPTTAVAAATFVAGAGTAVNDASTFDGYTVKQVVKALRNIGLLA